MSDTEPTSASHLPQLLGIEMLEMAHGHTRAQLKLHQALLAPNGYLHAGTVVTLADTCAGFGCMHSLPPGAHSFTTIELKSNHLGTARDGVIQCEARLVHGGRTTQVWDATVSAGDRTLALFRCTQMLLYPKT